MLISSKNSLFTAPLSFQNKPLDATEVIRIEKLLADNHRSDMIEEKQVIRDIQKIKNITAEIRSISKQGVVLMGERVQRAQMILKSYKDGTFSQWLETTFGSKKTGYNVLAYFELYEKLSNDDIREMLKKIPLRAAYVIASRSGNTQVKEEIIRENYHLGHDEFVTIIQEKLPIATADRRAYKSSNNRLIIKLSETLNKLLERKESFSEGNKKSISGLLFANIKHLKKHSPK